MTSTTLIFYVSSFSFIFILGHFILCYVLDILASRIACTDVWGWRLMIRLSFLFRLSEFVPFETRYIYLVCLYLGRLRRDLFTSAFFWFTRDDRNKRYLAVYSFPFLFSLPFSSLFLSFLMSYPVSSPVSLLSYVILCSFMSWKGSFSLAINLFLSYISFLSYQSFSPFLPFLRSLLLFFPFLNITANNR